MSNDALNKGRVNDRRMISRVIHVFKSGRKRNDASEGRFEKRTAFYRPNPATRIALRASPKQPFVRRSATSAWSWGASPLLMISGTIALLLAPGCFLILPIVIHVDDYGPSATSAHPEVP